MGHSSCNRPKAAELPRSQWIGKEVDLLNEAGLLSAKGFVQFIGENQCINGHSALGKDKVGVVIYDVVTGEPYKLHSLKEWNTSYTVYKGQSLREYEESHQNSVESNVCRKGKRVYNSARVPARMKFRKKDKLLSSSNIKETLKTKCCKEACVTKFSSHAIMTARHEMHHSTYLRKTDLKLAVHRSCGLSSKSGQKMTVVKGRLVCMKAWRIVYGVADSCFYKYQQLARNGMRAQNHGNKNMPRTRKSTKQAVKSMKILLEHKSDTMPHCTRTLPSGDKVVEKVLPSDTTWKRILEDVNIAQVDAGMKKVSQSSCSRIRKKHFHDFVVKRSGDNFARCGRCDKLLNLRNAQAVNSPPWLVCNEKFQNHLNEQESARNQYYASRAMSQYYPDQVLSIMHDKMDHSKTASPCFANKTKATDGFFKMPLSVSGILAHGHGDKKYAHFILDKFPANSNQTIGSICKLLRDLEQEPIYSNPNQLLQRHYSSPLYDAVLEGFDTCKQLVNVRSEGIRIARKLPPVLHVQLDNCWKDNKSRFIMCFWSLLVAKRIFNKIKVSYMVVGHTHDDIDALFGRWSMDLRKRDYPTMPLLMKSLMVLEKEPVIPHLIEEVPDFKSFIASCICTGNEELVGHTSGHQFLFTRRTDNWPIMQYKLHSTDEEWLPKEGIKLWKEDEVGNPILPIGQPKSVKPLPFKGEEEIKRGIGGFIDNWKSLINADRSGKCEEKYGTLITYWEKVKETIGCSEERNQSLLEEFWPSTRQMYEETLLAAAEALAEEDNNMEEVFIGQRALCPDPPFCIRKDCKKGYFLTVRPAEDSADPVWLGLAKSDLVFEVGSPNHKQILLQWYKPVKRRGVVAGSCVGWEKSPPLKWQPDTKAFEQAEWVNTNAVITAWRPRGKNVEKVSIPVVHISRTVLVLATSIE